MRDAAAASPGDRCAQQGLIVALDPMWPFLHQKVGAGLLEGSLGPSLLPPPSPAAPEGVRASSRPVGFLSVKGPVLLASTPTRPAQPSPFLPVVT